MAKTRTEIDKEMMYRKIMPSAAKKDTLGNAGDMHADGAVQAASAGMAREAEGACVRYVRRTGLWVPDTAHSGIHGKSLKAQSGYPCHLRRRTTGCW